MTRNLCYLGAVRGGIDAGAWIWAAAWALDLLTRPIIWIAQGVVLDRGESEMVDTFFTISEGWSCCIGVVIVLGLGLALFDPAYRAGRAFLGGAAAMFVMAILLSSVLFAIGQAVGEVIEYDPAIGDLMRYAGVCFLPIFVIATALLALGARAIDLEGAKKLPSLVYFVPLLLALLTTCLRVPQWTDADVPARSLWLWGGRVFSFLTDLVVLVLVLIALAGTKVRNEPRAA